MNEEAIAHVGLHCPKKKKKLCSTAYKEEIICTFCSGIYLLGNSVSSRLICSK